MSATFETVLKALQSLENQGYVFSKEPEGRLGITPHPPVGSPILKFAALYKANILAELDKRNQVSAHQQFKARAQDLFGEPKEVFEVTLEDMFRQADALFQGVSQELRLRVLSRLISVSAGCQVVQGRVIAYFWRDPPKFAYSERVLPKTLKNGG